MLRWAVSLDGSLNTAKSRSLLAAGVDHIASAEARRAVTGWGAAVEGMRSSMTEWAEAVLQSKELGPGDWEWARHLG